MPAPKITQLISILRRVRHDAIVFFIVAFLSFLSFQDRVSDQDQCRSAYFEFQSFIGSDTLSHRPVQLSQTSGQEHLNCICHISEDFFIRLIKHHKTVFASDAIEAALESKSFSRLHQAAQALSLSYEFLRLNILSSKAHPPTSTL